MATPVTLFATFKAFLASFTSAISPFAAVTGVTLTAGGASAVLVLQSSVGGATSEFTAYKGVNYAGVPGPDIAGGLPVLLMVAAYAGYSLYRKNKRKNEIAA